MIGIVWGATRIRANKKLETIIEYYKRKGIKPIQIRKTSSGELSVVFENGEQWYAVNAIECRRGLSCNVSLIDKNINEEFKTRIIFPCTKSFPWTAIGYY